MVRYDDELLFLPRVSSFEREKKQEENKRIVFMYFFFFAILYTYIYQSIEEE